MHNLPMSVSAYELESASLGTYSSSTNEVVSQKLDSSIHACFQAVGPTPGVVRFTELVV